jgi:hypothetical protein
MTSRKAGGRDALPAKTPATTNTQQGQEYTAGQTKVQVSGLDGTPTGSTSSSTGYGSILDRPSTTTRRRCAGRYCWCHRGSYVGGDELDPDSTYWDWRTRMDSLAIAIRSIEVADGIPL